MRIRECISRTVSARASIFSDSRRPPCTNIFAEIRIRSATTTLPHRNARVGTPDPERPSRKALAETLEPERPHEKARQKSNTVSHESPFCVRAKDSNARDEFPFRNRFNKRRVKGSRGGGESRTEYTYDGPEFPSRIDQKSE